MFKIDLNGLKDGTTSLEFSLGDSYFEAIKAPEVKHGELLLKLNIERRGRYFDLCFNITGTVQVSCDLCLENMALAINTNDKLVVKLGKEYFEDEDFITVDENKGSIDVSWIIYEFIVLAIPIKHVHASGECNPAMIEKLNEHSAIRNSDGKDFNTIDSRWRKLEKLRTIIKD